MAKNESSSDGTVQAQRANALNIAAEQFDRSAKDRVTGNEVAAELRKLVPAEYFEKAIRRFDRSGNDYWTGEAVAFELRCIAGLIDVDASMRDVSRIVTR